MRTGIITIDLSLRLVVRRGFINIYPVKRQVYSRVRERILANSLSASML
jgi:hypothetical protein